MRTVIADTIFEGEFRLGKRLKRNAYQIQVRRNNPDYNNRWWALNGHLYREDHRLRSARRRSINPEQFNAERRAEYARDPIKHRERAANYSENNADQLRQKRSNKWQELKNDPVAYKKHLAVRRPLMKKYIRRRRSNDPEFALKDKLQARIRVALLRIGTNKSRRTTELIGCDILFLRNHLESLFQPGMTWDNYGRNGWHIDHEKPCASFDLTNPIEQLKCFNFTNLQPLWESDNIRKGAHIKDG